MGTALVLRRSPKRRRRTSASRAAHERASRSGPARVAAAHPAGKPLNRLGLAYWLVDENNPLTARVVVNRFWGELFGRALVETERGLRHPGRAAPRIPELLDWLATEFMAGALEHEGHPPDDRHVGDLPAVVAGDAGAPRARPGQPAAGARAAVPAGGRDDPRRDAGGQRAADATRSAARASSRRRPDIERRRRDQRRARPGPRAQGEDRYRRGLYTFWRRTAPYPAFASFDAPSREICTVRRPRTNTPLQALSDAERPGLRRGRAGPGAARTCAKAPRGPAARDRPTRSASAGPRSRRRPRSRRWSPPSCGSSTTSRTERRAGRERRVRRGAADPRGRGAELAAWTAVANVLREPRRDADEGVSMSPANAALSGVTRRHFFQQTGFGLGALALLALLQPRSLPAQAGRRCQSAGRAKPPHFAAEGEERHLPVHDGRALASSTCSTTSRSSRQLHGQPSPTSSSRASGSRSSRACRSCSARRTRSAATGSRARRISSLLPHLTRRSSTTSPSCKSVHTDQFNHAPAQLFMNTGHTLVGRPSMGSWLTYGLGTENRRTCPASSCPDLGETDPAAGSACWEQRLPADVYQGVQFRSQGDPVLVRRRTPTGMDPGRAAAHARRAARAQPAAARRGRRPRDRDAHRRLRDGLPDADERPGADGHRARAASAIHAMYGTRAGEGLVRQQLPAGPAAGRARRAVRPALPPGLGPPRHGHGRRHHARPARALPRDRPGRGRRCSRT